LHARATEESTHASSLSTRPSCSSLSSHVVNVEPSVAGVAPAAIATVVTGALLPLQLRRRRAVLLLLRTPRVGATAAALKARGAAARVAAMMMMCLCNAESRERCRLAVACATVRGRTINIVPC
jgi:hypothetical protein